MSGLGETGMLLLGRLAKPGRVGAARAFWRAAGVLTLRRRDMTPRNIGIAVIVAVIVIVVIAFIL